MIPLLCMKRVHDTLQRLCSTPRSALRRQSPSRLGCYRFSASRTAYKIPGAHGFSQSPETQDQQWEGRQISEAVSRLKKRIVMKLCLFHRPLAENSYKAAAVQPVDLPRPRWTRDPWCCRVDGKALACPQCPAQEQSSDHLVAAKWQQRRSWGSKPSLPRTGPVILPSQTRS